MIARRALAAATLAVGLALTGCAVTGTAVTTGASGASGASETAEASVMIEDAWAKAADAGAMTAMFGTLHNHGDQDITLVSATSSASADLQLHETTADASGNMVMSEVDGGLVIPAGGELALEPGGDHVMFMGLDDALLPGDEVPVTLTFDDGSTLDVSAAVKDFAGAEENYDSEHEGH